jgi:UDP-glucose:(heptosyl)LPS alpha-1,3-glucosyltransferase
MRIAYVVHDYRRMEGHSRYVVELASRFARDHEVHVFANQIESDGRDGIHFHHIPAWRPNALSSILTFALQATARVRGDFDIIHNQGLCGLRGNIYTAHICNRAWHRALRQTSGLSFREWVSGVTLSALEDIFYRSARRCHVIAVSKRVADDVRSLYGLTAPATVIHHGVDLDTFSPARRESLRQQARAECGVNGTEKAFLFVGDMRKGGRQCIAALSNLDSGKLLFVSRSPTAPYQQLATSLGVAGRVRFVGVSSQVDRYYAAADAFLLPTHYDSFGMVVTEAMAFGLPVIVSREAGASELIEDGHNGLLLTDYRDSSELARKMRIVAEDQEIADRLGHCARRTVEKHSWDTVAACTMSVYQCVLDARKRPQPGILADQTTFN